MKEIDFKEAFRNYKRVSEIVSRDGANFVLRFTDDTLGRFDLNKYIDRSEALDIIQVPLVNDTCIIKDDCLTWPSLGAMLDGENGLETWYDFQLDPVMVWALTDFSPSGGE
jgi:hypothetical protein